ncbi:MAG: 5-formyltetrahydrofolate cyclo-ligase [bacterium]|nr:5-formyltetrahydrofolate cyclo-ligase [bacterium]
MSLSRKDEIRRDRLEARRQLSAMEAATRSAAILERLMNVAVFIHAETVLAYVSSKDNEVDTHAAIQTLLARGRRVLVPVARDGGLLEWSAVNDLNELAPSTFGILEPREECLRLETPRSDAVALVPGIAFSPQGGRIGYGGGYYDRFLAGFDGATIGLAYELQMVRNIPVEAHDRLVGMVVTESRVYAPVPQLDSGPTT